MVLADLSTQDSVSKHLDTDILSAPILPWTYCPWHVVTLLGVTTSSYWGTWETWNCSPEFASVKQELQNLGGWTQLYSDPVNRQSLWPPLFSFLPRRYLPMFCSPLAPGNPCILCSGKGLDGASSWAPAQLPISKTTFKHSQVVPEVGLPTCHWFSSLWFTWMRGTNSAGSWSWLSGKSTECPLTPFPMRSKITVGRGHVSVVSGLLQVWWPHNQ